MKSRKRLLSLFLSLAVMLTMCVTTATAMDADNGSAATITVETVKQAVKVDDEVTLNVSIANNPGFVVFDFTIQYDKEKLELQGIENGSFEGRLLGNTAAGKVNFTGDVQQECMEDGTLFILKFKVKADCSNGTQVGLKATTFKNANNATILPTIVSGGMTSGSTTGGSTTGGSTTGGSTTGGSTTGGSTTGGSTTGGSTTGGSTTGGSTTGGSTTGGSTTGGSTTGGSSTGSDRKVELVGKSNGATYKITGNMLNVQNDAACVVLWTDDNGATYTKLTATENPAGGYNFDLTGVPANAVIKIAIKGDIDGNGQVNSLDASRIARSLLPEGHNLLVKLDTLSQTLADIDGNDTVNLLDSSAISRSILPSTNNLYRALSW